MLANRLKKARDLHGAQKISVDSGVSPSTIQSIISGEKKERSLRIRTALERYLKEVGL